MPAARVSPIDPRLDQPTRCRGVAADDAQLPDLLTALEAVPDPLAVYVLVVDEINRGNLAKILGELNTLIDDEDFKIGPSYFMRPAVFEPNGLERVWKYNILPLLEEFHYGDRGVDVHATYGLERVRKRLAAKVSSASENESDNDDDTVADRG